MFRFRRSQKALLARTLLGLPEEASQAQWAEAAESLRRHIRERRDRSEESLFRSARETELQRLEQTLAPSPASAPKKRPRALPGKTPFFWGAALVLVALAGLRFGLAYLSNESPPLSPSPRPSLAVLADPPGATFWLLDPSDESVLIRAAANGQRSEWPEGEYQLRVEHPDCPDTWDRMIRLPSGGNKVFEPRLCQGEAQLIVRGNLANDRVQVDGFDVGPSGETPHPLRVGKHRVSVQKEGFVPWEAQVALRPDQTLTLLAELTPEASATSEAKNSPPPPPANPTPSASSPPPPAGAPGRSSPESDFKERTSLKPGPGLGGSKTWHDAIKHELVSTYDQNGSRSLDTQEELLSIPCSVWLNIEKQYETGGLGVDMTHLYGFDGSDAPANTLGITYGLRGEAFQRMKDCGLKTRL